MPVDPVCGIELDEELALIHDHDGKKVYFCCSGCRRIFLKKPRKYKNNIYSSGILYNEFSDKYFESGI